jgi:hypothetical protein
VVGTIEDAVTAEQASLLIETAQVFADADPGDAITFSGTLADGSALPDWITIDAITGVLEALPGRDDAGDYQVTVTATDSAGANVSITVSIAVQDRLDGTTVDGYIAGATVFADTNGNGILDNGEAFTVTDASGEFSLVGGSGDLIMFGGTDISTGLAFKGKLSAPEGSTVVTPLTTLVVAYAEQSGGGSPDYAQAEADLKAALGLPDVDLTTTDPVALAVSGDAQGVELLATQVKIQNTVLQAAAVVDGASGGTVDEDTGVQSAFEGLAASISETAGFSLEDSGSIEQVIARTATKTAENTGTSEATIDSTVLAAATSVISQSNTAIETIGYTEGSSDPISTLKEIAKVAIVSQDEASKELADSAASGTVSSNLDSLNTNFSNAVAAAETRVGDVDGTNEGPRSEFLVNDVATSFQQTPALTSLAGGGFVVAWDTPNARAKIYDAQGQVVADEFQIGFGGFPDIAATDDGGFVAVWRGNGVVAKVFDANGNVTVPDFTVSQTPVSVGSDGTKVTVLENGNLAFTWYAQPAA